ncbi:TonB-dependent receptor [Sphingomonas crocodyli]|uniref:TonB-dependent receptor n=1 Tax=Sphingomonas crocodyli TaxID=1979270 RepID=A0A437M5Z9_9SPHN|nr:TonB-dependent receptor [Sphingomonas crocodyli]RVT92956.1 TonB-dependent receptor [Sphingomonas crocodyli]
MGISNKVSLLSGAMLVASANVICPAAANAQSATAPQASSTDVSEIVVTATKRDQALQDVPAAVSVVSGDLIKQFNASTLRDFAKLDPALQLTTNGVGDNNIIVRGIRSTGAATVALYFDEAVITGYNRENPVNGRAPDLGAYDIERIEVLKGPQGTLFGAGSMAGAVRIIPRRPNFNGASGNLTGAFSDGSGTNALYEMNGYINLPIVDDKVAARVVGWYSRGGGYIDNITSGKSNINDAETRGVRASLLFKPTENFSFLLTGLHQDITVDGAQRFKITDGEYKNSTRTREPHDEYANLVSGVADFDLGVGNIIATSSYFYRAVDEFVDTTPTAAGLGIAGNYSGPRHQNRSIWSNELRFASKFEGPFQLVAGGFYEKDENTYETNTTQTPLNALPACSSKAECDKAGLGGLIISARDVDNPIEQWAIFGQADWKIVPGLTLTAGARYYHASLKNLERTLQRLRRNPADLSTVQTVPTVAVNSSDSQSKPSYNFSIAYEPSRELTLYARAASGFRIGGLNNASTAAQFGVTIPDGFNSDSLWNYEVGVKGSLADGILNYDVAGYQIRWNGMQVTAFSPTGAFTYIVNAGKSVVNGAEAQLRFNLRNGFTATFGASYTDSHLTQDQPIAAANAANRGFDGDRTPFVAKWSAVGQLRYEAELNEGWKGYASANGNYRSGSATNFNPGTSNFYRLPDYFLADLVFGVKNDNGLDVSLLVTNLTNKAAQISIEVSADGFRAIAPRPRTFGLRVSKNF